MTILVHPGAYRMRGVLTAASPQRTAVRCPLLAGLTLTARAAWL